MSKLHDVQVEETERPVDLLTSLNHSMTETVHSIEIECRNHSRIAARWGWYRSRGTNRRVLPCCMNPSISEKL